ncbi:MAG: hypothetical protein ACTSP4_05365 [Candidatus Hodarchaeales archaeon]
MIDNLSLSERGRVKLKQCVIGFKENDLFIKGPVVPFLADLEHIEDTKLGISRFKPSDYPVIKTRLLAIYSFTLIKRRRTNLGEKLDIEEWLSCLPGQVNHTLPLKPYLN